MKGSIPWQRSCLVLILAASSLGGLIRSIDAQQSSTEAASPDRKTETVEWVYRVRYGHEREWFRIFRKYQIAILEKQKQLGYVKDYTIWSPGLHASEDARWDYRVIIVRAAGEASPGQSEDEVARQLFPDREGFQRDEDRRWELTANHWDLPIHQVQKDSD